MTIDSLNLDMLENKYCEILALTHHAIDNKISITTLVSLGTP